LLKIKLANMEKQKLTKNIFNQVESVLQEALKRKSKISDALLIYDLEPNFMDGILQKIQRAFNEGIINENKRNTLISLYSKYTSSIINSNKKLNKQPSLKKKKVVKLKSKKQSKNNTKTKSTILNDNYNINSDESDNDVVLEDEVLDFDSRSVGEIIRGDESYIDNQGQQRRKITGYEYRIMVHGKDDISGRFSRDEMSSIYALYSTLDGQGLSIRSVSREFPNLSYRSMKKVLSSFTISKNSCPVAPHELEELDETSLLELVRIRKENSLLKRLDMDRGKYYEKKYFDTQKEISIIKSSSDFIENVVNSYFKKNKLSIPQSSKKVLTKTTSKIKNTNSKNGSKPIFCVFGDIHFGKWFDGTIHGRSYNSTIANERIQQIAKITIEEANKKKSSEIVMINLGDILETVLPEGMHPNHAQEVDLMCEEQVMFAISSLENLLRTILSQTTCKISFNTIHGNHDRIQKSRDEDNGRTGGQIVSHIVKKLFEKETRVEFNIPKNNILRITRNKTFFLATHGDSPLSKRKPEELVQLYGEPQHYSVLLMGHFHSIKTSEFTNGISLQIPAVASPDQYTQNFLGRSSCPGFIIGEIPGGENSGTPDQNEYVGFDYKKYTLY
jgi:predicted phosphodiesterase